ncbi:MAG: cation transporter [Spirochaetes bacterium]|nr:cation transporter [Spirochaetota bacterium]
MKISSERSSSAIKVTYIGSVINVMLTLAKFIAGVAGNSRAMIADAVHSLSDFVTDIVVIASLFISGKPEDEDHDYGHGKFETLATALIGIALFAVGSGIIYSSSLTVYHYINGSEIKKPGTIAIAAAALSVIVKELLYRYTKIHAEKLNSSALLANAWHHRSDAFSSIATLTGISAAVFFGEKFRICDPLAGIFVSILIIKVSVSITKDSFNELMEASLTSSEEDEILKTVTGVKGVLNPHKLRTRKIGNKIAIDIHINVDPELNIVNAHDIATDVEDALYKKYGKGIYLNVHIEPHV